MAALNEQISGNHYKDLKIQPVEYIHANSLGFCEGSVVKYITRWRTKNGLADLKKAKHFIELLIQLEGLDSQSYGEHACGKCNGHNMVVNHNEYFCDDCFYVGGLDGSA